jgi:non-canonical (house-cleaning) NTP pyrophosphatase
MASPEKIIVAVGSTRRPKVEAVREAIGLLAPRLAADATFEIVGIETPSGVAHTPLSREETMLGARQRAEALMQMNRSQGVAWKYFVGLEGGLDVVAANGLQAATASCERAVDATVSRERLVDATVSRERLVFLQNWAYVTDGAIAAYGQSGGVLLPEALAREVVDKDVELAHAIDAFAGQHGIRDGQGAWGILTGGVITRQDAFRVAVINAFAPFINHAAYSAE